MAEAISRQEESGRHPPPRAAYIDVARGLLITLVVVGHVCQSLYNNGLWNNENSYLVIHRWIYAFHMPAFFLISGLFAMHSAQRSGMAFITRKIQTIAYPYLLWSVLQTSIQVLMSGSTTHSLSVADILYIPVYPQMQFWFLYALFFISLFFILLKQVTSSRGIFLGVGVILFVLFQLGYGMNTPALHYLGRDFIYFSIGIFCSKPLLSDMMEKPLENRRLLLYALLLFSVTLCIPRLPDVLFPAAESWAAPLLAMPGIFLVLFISPWLVSNSKRLAALFIFLGRRSLEILVAHTLFTAGLRIILHRIIVFEPVGYHLVLGIVVGLAGPVFLCWLADRLGWKYLFSWPAGREKKNKVDGVFA